MLSEERLEAVETVLPEGAVALKPAGELVKAIRAQLVDALLSCDSGADEAALTKHAQMAGDCRLRDTAESGQVADRLLPLGQGAEELAARIVGERCEYMHAWSI